MSFSSQARGFRPFVTLGVGALGVGVWASLAGAGIAAADNQSSGASGAAASATPTASAKTTKSTRPTTRSARVRAIAAGFITNPQSGPVDLIGGTFLLETGGGGEYAGAGLSPAWKPDLLFGTAASRDISSLLPDSLQSSSHVDGTNSALEYTHSPGLR
jgi:hypothetical protein